MRTTLTYSHSFLLIGRGITQLAICCYNTVMQNKALSLLVMSAMLNIALILALGDERVKSDALSQENAHLTISNDSLGGANTNISYRYN